jgi:hypothetical protein
MRMAVQAAVSSSVQDFFQVQSSARTDACPQEAVSPDGGAGREFKKLLLSMRQAKRDAPAAALSDAKPLVPAIVKNAALAGEAAPVLDTETAGDGEAAREDAAAAPAERAAGHFDPDVILGIPRKAEDENTEDAEKEETEEEKPAAGEAASRDEPEKTAVFGNAGAANALADEIVSERTPSVSVSEKPEEPAEEAGASVAGPAARKYDGDESGEEPVFAKSLPEQDEPVEKPASAEPSGEHAAEDAALANAGAVRGADVSAPPEENAEKTAPAPSERPGKTHRNTENNVAGPGEKAVSRREVSQTKDASEKSEKIFSVFRVCVLAARGKPDMTEPTAVLILNRLRYDLHTKG